MCIAPSGSRTAGKSFFEAREHLYRLAISPNKPRLSQARRSSTILITGGATREPRHWTESLRTEHLRVESSCSRPIFSAERRTAAVLEDRFPTCPLPFRTRRIFSMSGGGAPQSAVDGRIDTNLSIAPRTDICLHLRPVSHSRFFPPRLVPLGCSLSDHELGIPPCGPARSLPLRF